MATPPIFLTHVVPTSTSRPQQQQQQQQGDAAANQYPPLTFDDVRRSFLSLDINHIAQQGFLRPCLQPALDASIAAFVAKQQQQQQQQNITTLSSQRQQMIHQLNSRRVPIVSGGPTASATPLVLQVVDAVDVTKSLTERTQGVMSTASGIALPVGKVHGVKNNTNNNAIHGASNSNAGAGGNNTNVNSPATSLTAARGLSKLLLSDGFTTIVAIEVVSCPMLDNLGIGAKIVINAASAAAQTTSNTVMVAASANQPNGSGGVSLGTITTTVPSFINLSASSLLNHLGSGGGGASGTIVPPTPSTLVLGLTPSTIAACQGLVPSMALLHNERMAVTAHKLTGRPMGIMVGAGRGGGNANSSTNNGDDDEEMLMMMGEGDGGGGAAHPNYNRGDDDDSNMFLNLGAMGIGAGGGGGMPVATARPQRTLLTFGGGGGGANRANTAAASDGGAVGAVTSQQQQQHHPHPTAPPSVAAAPQPAATVVSLAPVITTTTTITNASWQSGGGGGVGVGGGASISSLRVVELDCDEDDDNANATTMTAPPTNAYSAAPTVTAPIPSAAPTAPIPQNASPPLPSSSSSSSPSLPRKLVLYGRIEELVSELSVIRLAGNGAYGYEDGTIRGEAGYSLSAAVHVQAGVADVTRDADLAPYALRPENNDGYQPQPHHQQPHANMLSVELGTPFVRDLLGGVEPWQYQSLLEDPSRHEELMRVADMVATRLIELPSLYFTLIVPPSPSTHAVVKQEGGSSSPFPPPVLPLRVLAASDTPPQSWAQ